MFEKYFIRTFFVKSTDLTRNSEVLSCCEHSVRAHRPSEPSPMSQSKLVGAVGDWETLYSTNLFFLSKLISLTKNHDLRVDLAPDDGFF